MSFAMNRRTLMRGLIAGGALGGTAAAFPSAARAAESLSSEVASGAVSVKAHGAVGDGTTHETEVLQRILDGVAAEGGGVVILPPGRYVLEKTLLIPSNVHIIGHGARTVLEAARPDDVNGFALISNAGITTAEGYDGAHDFSLQNVAIDAPRANGITLVHARNGYFSQIYGVDAYHHHFDIAGCQNIVTENIFLTGRSGTAPYQIDGSPFNNNIWDGETNVPPIRDGTPNDGIFLSNSVIRPTNRPNHGIHLHREGGQNILVHNVLVEHVQNGIYRDPNCRWNDVAFSQIAIRDVSRFGVLFRETDRPDERVTFDNIMIEEVGSEGFLEYHGCRSLTLRNFKAVANEESGSKRLALRDVDGAVIDDAQLVGGGSGSAAWLRRCRNVLVSKVIARHVSRSLRLEECENISYSGLCELAEDGTPKELTIQGSDALTPWQQS